MGNKRLLVISAVVVVWFCVTVSAKPTSRRLKNKTVKDTDVVTSSKTETETGISTDKVETPSGIFKAPETDLKNDTQTSHKPRKSHRRKGHHKRRLHGMRRHRDKAFKRRHQNDNGQENNKENHKDDNVELLRASSGKLDLAARKLHSGHSGRKSRRHNHSHHHRPHTKKSSTNTKPKEQLASINKDIP